MSTIVDKQSKSISGSTELDASHTATAGLRGADETSALLAANMFDENAYKGVAAEEDRSTPEAEENTKQQRRGRYISKYLTSSYSNNSFVAYLNLGTSASDMLTVTHNICKTGVQESK